MTATLSFDIEEFDFPIERGHNICEEEQFNISREGLDYIISTLKERDIKATFYITANFAEHNTDLIDKIVENGHEIASHDYYHSMVARSQAPESKLLLEKISKQTIYGYRAPRLSSESSSSLFDAGYKYNSSVNPTWIPGRYNNLKSPRAPYYEDNLLIYPVSVAYPIRIPLFWLSLHLFPFTVYKILARTALKHDNNIHLYFHPWEFSDGIRNRQYGIPSYISKTSGHLLRKRFEQLLNWLISIDVRLTTTRDYLGLEK